MSLFRVRSQRFIDLSSYSEHFVHYVRKVRQNFEDRTIIAGNVVTGEMVEELILSGADIIKVGIGPGKINIRAIQTAKLRVKYVKYWREFYIFCLRTEF